MAKLTTTTGALERGRQAVGKHAWEEAFAELSAADRDRALEPADLELLDVAGIARWHGRVQRHPSRITFRFKSPRYNVIPPASSAGDDRAVQPSLQAGYGRCAAV